MRPNKDLLDKNLYQWVNDNNIDRGHPYSKGWWDYVEAFYRIINTFDLPIEVVRVYGTFEFETPPPCTPITMPIIAIELDELTLVFRWYFSYSGFEDSMVIGSSMEIDENVLVRPLDNHFKYDNIKHSESDVLRGLNLNEYSIPDLEDIYSLIILLMDKEEINLKLRRNNFVKENNDNNCSNDNADNDS